MRAFERAAWWSIGLLLIANAPAVAQDPPPTTPVDSVATAASGPATLLHGMPQMGFYAAPFSRFGSVRRQLAVYPGLRLGVVLDQSFAIGVSAGLLANHIALDAEPGKDLDLKYGGLEIEALIASNRVINGSIRVLGGAGLLAAGPAAPDPGGEGAAPALASPEKILIVEPGVDVTINLSRMLRLSAGWNYRWVRGVDATLIGNDDLGGWLGSVTIRIAMY